MSHTLFSDLASHDGKKPRVQRTATGWHVAAAAGITARIKGYRDGLICRVAPGSDTDVVQLGIGQTESLLCNALYSPSQDTALVFTAEDLVLSPARRKGQRIRGFTVSSSGPVTITVLENYLRIHRNLPWFTPLRRDIFPRPPAGWCSWYYYYLGITEEEIIKNTDWLTEHLRPYGCEWVQIDDGWQGRGDGYGTNRNWFVTCERDFPRGMQWCAKYIRDHGLRPGIWCIPFSQSDDALFQRIPALFVRTPDGASPGDRHEALEYEWMPEDERLVDWPGRYYLDPTGPEGQAYLKRLFTMLCEEWGYDYVKIDAQGGMADFYAQHRRQLADPAQDGTHAYQRGLSVAKEVMGKHRFLLNCGGGWSSVGLCEGIRIGGDVGMEWSGMQPAISSTLEWLFLNTLAFYTDPDVVLVREPLPFTMAQAWATFVGITGQLLMASDKMYELPDERVELLRRIFPVADIHPMELYPLSSAVKPNIFDLHVHLPNVGKWEVVAIFNWNESEETTVPLSPARLGLSGTHWLSLDVWSGAVLHEGDGVQEITVPAQSCRVISYWPLGVTPQIVGTNRHLTQGAIDLHAVEWDQTKLLLSGVSSVVGNDPYQVRIYVPDGYIPVDDIPQNGHLATLTITRPQNETVEWEMAFTRV